MQESSTVDAVRVEKETGPILGEGALRALKRSEEQTAWQAEYYKNIPDDLIIGGKRAGLRRAGKEAALNAQYRKTGAGPTGTVRLNRKARRSAR
jgi:hypothetical protein